MIQKMTAFAIAVFLVCSSVVTAQQPGKAAGDPPGRDSILDWNAIALAAVAEDFSNTYGAPEQPGPTHTSRALAIVHLAMFDAANTVKPTAVPYLAVHTPTKEKSVSFDAAVAKAAAVTLTVLYPKQAAVFTTALSNYLVPLTNVTARDKGIAIGQTVAVDILSTRMHDESNLTGSYVPSGKAGTHDVDPLNPGQGFLDPDWGQVAPFSPSHSFHYVPHAPPSMGSHAYAQAFNDVKSIGGDGITTSTTRTPEQTQIGIFWAYDGSPRIGTPPRLYNQIARTIAIQQKNSETDNARLFALANAAMADAGILCWGMKYQYCVWRPVLGIRRANEDGNLSTEADTSWTPLDSPASNRIGKNFTPNFPSYSSGHASFGAAFFRTVQNYYGRDHLPFTFVSDELNGITTDSKGNVRPLQPRHFQLLSDAAYENARSRMYLGVHWQFDADEGLRSGTAVGDHVFHTILKRR